MTQRLRFDSSAAATITNYSSHGAASVHLGSGSGENHTYVIHFEPGGEIGEHETGFGQLFIVIEGEGWVRADNELHRVGVGDTMFVPRGVLHSKGSESGMTAVMVQSFDLDPGTT